jgi:hypothetical protein
VYNVKQNATLQLEKGIYQWSGEKWKKLNRITKTEGAAVKKEIYQANSPNESRTVALGIFEFRINNNSIPQFRTISGTGNRSFYWQVNRYWDENPSNEATSFSNSGYASELKEENNVQANTWKDCSSNALSNVGKTEVWLADLVNQNMYHIQFIIFGNNSPQRYLILAEKY